MKKDWTKNSFPKSWGQLTLALQGKMLLSYFSFMQWYLYLYLSNIFILSVSCVKKAVPSDNKRHNFP